MTFQEGKNYKHVSMLDLELHITYVYPEHGSFQYLGVRYWNPHMKAFQGEHDLVFIKKPDFDKWSEV